MKEEKIQLKIVEPTDDDDEGLVAYLTLPDHPGKGTPGCVSYQKRLADLIDDYKGPDLYFDFDKNDRLIGVEILT